MKTLAWPALFLLVGSAAFGQATVVMQQGCDPLPDGTHGPKGDQCYVKGAPAAPKPEWAAPIVTIEGNGVVARTCPDGYGWLPSPTGQETITTNPCHLIPLFASPAPKPDQTMTVNCPEWHTETCDPDHLLPDLTAPKPEPPDVPAISWNIWVTRRDIGQEWTSEDNFKKACLESHLQYSATKQACLKVGHTCKPKTLILQNDEQEPPTFWCHRVDTGAEGGK